MRRNTVGRILGCLVLFAVSGTAWIMTLGEAQVHAAGEALLARASSVDDSATERLVAQLEDTNGDGIASAGDTVRTDEYPKDFDGQAYGNFTQTTHVIDTVQQDSSTGITVLAGDLRFAWAVIPDAEVYSEYDVTDALPTSTEFTDALSTAPVFGESIKTSETSPSLPDSTLNSSRAQQATDDAFINIELTDELSGAPLTSLVPGRVLETRPGEMTVDGEFQGIGKQAADEVIELVVAGRAGVPADADAVMMNLTAVFPDAPGFLSVFPCGSKRPNASNVNYGPGDVVPNAVLAKIGAGGKVCIYTKAATDIVADINGYVP